MRVENNIKMLVSIGLGCSADEWAGGNILERLAVNVQHLLRAHTVLGHCVLGARQLLGHCTMPSAACTE